MAMKTIYMLISDMKTSYVNKKDEMTYGNK